uniref:Uncharacterized protein n=1 Tax=Anguilla anguilla TaxID=7936 RepID=A0A0E9V3Z2_ANGAN
MGSLCNSKCINANIVFYEVPFSY